MTLGFLLLIYTTFTIIQNRDEPLIEILILLFGLPALLLASFGYFMRQEKVWAVWLLRIVVAGIVLGGTVLHLFMGLDVFSKPQLAFPLIIGSVIWLVLSFL